MTRLFADTYALIELFKGNPNYEDYSQADLVATEFNIFELTYALFRDFGRNETSKIIDFVRSRVEVTSTEDSDYLNASDFRKSANKTGKSFHWLMPLGIRIQERLVLNF